MTAHPDFPAAHPGATIVEHLEFMGLPTAKAAEILGVTRQSLHNLIKKDRPGSLTAEMALRLERSFGLPAALLMRVQGAHDLWRARQAGAYTGARKAA